MILYAQTIQNMDSYHVIDPNGPLPFLWHYHHLIFELQELKVVFHPEQSECIRGALGLGQHQASLLAVSLVELSDLAGDAPGVIPDRYRHTNFLHADIRRATTDFGGLDPARLAAVSDLSRRLPARETGDVTQTAYDPLTLGIFSVLEPC